MIFVTGDCHGDFGRFSTKEFPRQKELTKDDLVIILGDAAFVWEGSKEEKWWLDWFESKPFTTINIGGNHENYDLLEQYPKIRWHGGEAYQLRASVLHLCRGYTFDLNGLKTFVMGGAQSHDADKILQPGPDLARQRQRLEWLHIPYRVLGQTWWPQELPSQEEFITARNTLDREGWSVDLVLSHCAPTELQSQIVRNYPANDLTEFFQVLLGHLSYGQWFCGHYHRSEQFPEHRFRVLGEEIISLQHPEKSVSPQPEAVFSDKEGAAQ